VWSLNAPISLTCLSIAWLCDVADCLIVAWHSDIADYFLIAWLRHVAESIDVASLYDVADGLIVAWLRDIADYPGFSQPIRCRRIRAHGAVGRPVTQPPPHRSRRAELPHRAPQGYSLRTPAEETAGPIAIPHSEVGFMSQPYMSGWSFLYGLRNLAGPFPMYTAFPCSEYYEPVRLPKSHQTASHLGRSVLPAERRLGFGLSSGPGFPLWI